MTRSSVSNRNLQTNRYIYSWNTRNPLLWEYSDFIKSYSVYEYLYKTFNVAQFCFFAVMYCNSYAYTFARWLQRTPTSRGADLSFHETWFAVTNARVSQLESVYISTGFPRTYCKIIRWIQHFHISAFCFPITHLRGQSISSSRFSV